MTAMGLGLPEHPVAGALDTMDAALDAAADAPVWSLSDGQVESLLEQAHRVEGRVHEVTLRLVAEADRRRAGDRKAATSTQAWLRRRLKLAPHEAKQHVTLAAALTGRLELTRQALAAGDISRAHAAVIVKVLDTLPSDAGSQGRVDAERELIGWCRDFDPGDVARLGRRLWEVIDCEAADAYEGKLLERQEREANRKRHLSFGGDGMGGHVLRGRFDTEAATLISSALDPLAKPLPSTADGPDPAPPASATPTR